MIMEFKLLNSNALNARCPFLYMKKQLKKQYVLGVKEVFAINVRKKKLYLYLFKN